MESVVATAEILKEDKEFLTITVSLKRAKGIDLAENKKQLRFGQPYWVRGNDGLFTNKAYVVSNKTNITELDQFMKDGRVYVPATWSDEKIYN